MTPTAVTHIIFKMVWARTIYVYCGLFQSFQNMLQLFDVYKHNIFSFIKDRSNPSVWNLVN